tara:strand:+ start:168 stop:791 length:624 start_codon:yes stop_codon:yes gene_type:complete
MNENKQSYLNNLGIFIVKYKFQFISIIIATFFLFGLYEYYKYKETEKTKDLSKIFIENYDNSLQNEKTSLIKLEEIASTKSGYAILAQIKIAQIKIKMNDYDSAFNIYKQTIIDNKSNQFYKDLIIVNAGYNLVEKISKNKIEEIINQTNIDTSDFKSHLYEIKFINSLKNINSKEIKNLYDRIMDDVEINQSVKQRIKKINEYNLN